MTNTIEQAFFKAYGIEPIKLPKCPSCGYYLGCPDRMNNHMDKVCVYDRFISCAHCSACVDKEDAGDYYEYINPVITAERVLALEGIVVEGFNRLSLYKNHFKDGAVFYCTQSPHLNIPTYMADGDTRQDALLSLLTQLKPELSEEVQEEVKAVFG